MTRPFCVIGFTALFTLFVMPVFPQKEAMGAAFAAALIAFVLSLAYKPSRKDKTLPTAFLTAAICILLLWNANCRYTAQQNTVINAQEVTVSGALADLPYQDNGKYYAVLRVQTLNGEPFRGKIRLVSRTPLELAPTDSITFRAKPFLLGGGAENEAVSAYYRAKGVVCGVYPDGEWTVVKNGNTSLYASILSVRAALTQAVLTVLPNAAGGVVACMSFGVKTALTAQSENAFRAVGISHLLVVSGLHLSTWTMYLFTALKKLRIRRRVRAWSGLLFVAFFAVLTGGAPSVLRAAIMAGTVFSAELFRREADAYNSVGLALAAMLFCNPFAARDISLLLSVCATVGILLFAKRLEAVLSRPVRYRKGKWIKLYRFVTSVVSVTLAAAVCTLPVQVWAFGVLSPAVILANLLSVTVGSVCMLCGMLGALFCVLHFAAFGNALLLASSGCAEYLLSVTAHLSALPFSVLPVRTNYMKLWLSVLFFGVAIGLLMRRKRICLRRVVCILMAVLFLLCNLVPFAQAEQTLQMTVADVGEGMAVVLRCQGETVLLLSGGEYYADSEICGILSSYGATKIDAMFLLNAEEADLPVALAVGTQYPIGTLYYAQTLHADTLPLGTGKLPIQKSAVALAGGKLHVFAQCQGGYSYAKLTYGAFSALISFCDTNNFKGDSASLLITTAVVPQNLRAKDFECIVMSTAAPENADFLSVQSNRIYTTAENGSLSFWITPSGEFQYARRG